MQRKEDENMNEITMNVIGRLPEVDDENERLALDHKQLAWCHSFMDNHRDGEAFYVNSCGIHLQRINETTSRCVAIVDHSYCYASLAMLAISFEKAGIDLQVDPYTVVTPYEPRDEEEVAETDVSNDVGVI